VVWSLTLSLASTAVPGPLGAGASIFGSTAVDLLLPDGERAAQYARAFSDVDYSNAKKRELLLLSALWDQRDQNHVFDALPPLPAGLMVGDPPVPLWASRHAVPTPEQTKALDAWLTDRTVKDATHWLEMAEADNSR
jgi:hypothetical protein